MWLALRNTFWRPFVLLLAILLVNVFIAALSVVMLKNSYRMAYVKHEKLIAQQDQLHTEWMKLLLEEGTWASNARIEQIATQEMNMVLPRANHSHIIVVHTENPTQDEAAFDHKPL